jgi:hypothetical protein
MRAHRVRFTRPAVREGHPRATKTRDGVTMYRRNMEGKHLKAEAIGEQRRRQESKCVKCGNWLEFADAVFESKTFQDGITNHVVHRKCPAIYGHDGSQQEES